MRHALEVRAPFLDPALVETALSPPAAAHFSILSGKRLLRRALRGIVPRHILRSPKRGFEVPVGHWLAGPLAALYREVVSRPVLQEIAGIEPRVAADWLSEHRARREDRGAALWGLFALCWWQRGPRRAHERAAATADRQLREVSSSEATFLRRSEG